MEKKYIKKVEVKFNELTKNEFNEYITHMQSLGGVTEDFEEIKNCSFTDFFLKGERFACFTEEKGKEIKYYIKA